MTQDKIRYFEARTAKLRQRKNELQAKAMKTQCADTMRRAMELQSEIEMIRVEVFYSEM